VVPARALVVSIVLCCLPWTACAQERSESDSASDGQERAQEGNESHSERDPSEVEVERVARRALPTTGFVRANRCPPAEPHVDWTLPGVLFGIGGAVVVGSIVVGLTWWRDRDAEAAACVLRDCALRGALENDRNAAVALTASLAALGLGFHVAAALAFLFVPMRYPSRFRCSAAAVGFVCAGMF
jgi:hypothetical protein